MRAAVCHGFGQPLVIEDLELAPPGAGQVEVEIAACAICHSDIHFIQGAWGGALPAVYGHEAAGRVAAVGAGVGHLRPGDHVSVTMIRSCGGCHYCAHGDEVLCEANFTAAAPSPLRTKDGGVVEQGLRTGAFAERIVVDTSQVVAIPDDIASEPAALLGCGVITGVGAVINTAAVGPGSSVVVIGAGGVGLNCLQGARLSDAQPVIALDLATDKLDAARGFGATHTIDPAEQDVLNEVRSLTGGRGADYVFVAVGARSAIEQGLGLIRRGGTLVVVGMPASGVIAGFEPSALAGNGQRVLGSKLGDTRVQRDIPKLVDLYRRGRLQLDELISARYPLERINEAMSAVVRGEARRNVIVF